MTQKKAFFQRRTPAEILKLNTDVVESPEGLVEIIKKLNNSKEAIIIDFPLAHPEFIDQTNPTYASRQTLRGIRKKKTFPSYLKLQQPRSKESALKETRIPLDIRNLEFLCMSGIQESENYIVGYMRYPIVGNDRSPILTPFWAIMQGAKIYGYNGRVCKNLPKEFFAGSEVVRDYSPTVFVKVPSTTKGKQRYLQQWRDVVSEKRNPLNNVLCWNTKPRYGFLKTDGFYEDEGKAPEHGIYNIGQKNDSTAQINVLGPHDVAGYHTIIRYFLSKGNYLPLEFSQFAVPSREDALFWNKLENNVLIKENGDVLKHPRIDQMSMLMARWIADNFKKNTSNEIQTSMYWDAERDGRISDYPWLPGEN